MPTFTAKATIKKVPFVGRIAKACNNLFLDRSSPESRKLVAQKIAEKQMICEKDPRFDPLIIFPEGGTTNGDYLIKFKKGAFLGEHSVLPFVFKYDSVYFSPNLAAFDMVASVYLSCYVPYSRITKIDLPIFKPNEYFFSHHQREGEERWETYARVVRDIMSEVSGIPTLDVDIEDKFEYLKVLKECGKQKHK